VAASRLNRRSAFAVPLQKLGLHHFACLRAVAEGVPASKAAWQHLPIEHESAAAKAYRDLLDHVRALTRRLGDPRWRLLGLDLKDQTAAGGVAPPIYEWADAEGLDEFSGEELQALYAERFGVPGEGALRRQKRNARLRERRLALLRELETTSTERASRFDALEGWLPLKLAQQLRPLGILLLGELRDRIAQGGRWWRGLKAFGPARAERLASLVAVLLGPIESTGWAVGLPGSNLQALSGEHGSNRSAVAVAGIQANDDREAIQAWVAARAGSSHTATQYQREAERFVLWCALERRSALSDATAEDCRAYIDFLANIPPQWISRRRVERMAPGWAPFKGQLSVASQQLALNILGSLFTWLVQAQYLAGSPWILVNRKLGDDELAGDAGDATSRAFTPAAWSALVGYLAGSTSPSAARLRWICVFEQAVGLRAAELLRAERRHLLEKPTGWVIRVHGKGRRNRLVPVPKVAIQATRVYFKARGSDFDKDPGETPLLASLDDHTVPISYQALHQTFTRFVNRAIKASRLSLDEREQALRSSMHWLRHTYATRAAEREVPPDVLQENLGQADPRTTARYYRAQMERRQAAIEKAFAEG
jgi:integrase